MAKFVCPYCFGRRDYTGRSMMEIAASDTGTDIFMEDTDVHFRSEYLSANDGNPLMKKGRRYRSLKEFEEQYLEDDKDEVMSEYEEWDFFRRKDDIQYTNFWRDRGGVSDDSFGKNLANYVPAHERPIIDPKNPEHQKYLKKQGKDYFHRDSDGMVDGIELLNGTICEQRVCPRCHNPLPTNYGKHEVKYINVIGIAGAGKTVYLSRLLDGMAELYAPKVGLTAQTGSESVEAFLKKNRVRKGQKLPVSTPYNVMQKPLFYEMAYSTGQNTKVVHTLVIYDIAGEMFKKGVEKSEFDSVAQYVEHANGILFLLDPVQFPAVRRVRQAMKAEETREMDEDEIAKLTTALEKLHGGVLKEKGNTKSDVPIAVCITKADLPEMATEEVLGNELFQRLTQDVERVNGSNGRPMTMFNAKDYKPIELGLRRFMQTDDNMSLDSYLETHFGKYDYFAFTALGCPVEKNEYGDEVPVGPVLVSKRIEEPLYWLFHQFGYIRKNALLYGEYRCPNPNCDHSRMDNEEFIKFYNGNEIAPRTLIVRRPGRHFFGRRTDTVSVNRHCKICGCYWLNHEDNPENTDTVFYYPEDVIRENDEENPGED